MLSDILRYVLYESNQGQVSILKEIKHIKDYIEIERLRLGNMVRVEIEISDQISDQNIEPMLLLTLVENAFKHSQIGVLKAAYVNIELATDNEFLYFKIKNNKAAIQNKLEKGIGNHNTITRLKLDYKDQYEYLITDLDKSYEIYLNIRL